MGRTKPRLHTRTVYRAYRNGLTGLYYWTGRAWDGTAAEAVPLSLAAWQALYQTLNEADRLHVGAYKEVIRV